MHVPGRQNHRGCAFGPVLQGQVQHGPDALAGALGGIQRPPGAKEGGSILLALGDDAGRFIEGVGPLDLRDIQGFAAQGAMAFMARHMEAGGMGSGVGAEEVGDGAFHQSSPWLSATFIMMAHSMRFLNSSQPASYTPRMLPVAW